MVQKKKFRLAEKDERLCVYARHAFVSPLVINCSTSENDNESESRRYREQRKHILRYHLDIALLIRGEDYLSGFIHQPSGAVFSNLRLL